MAENPGSSGLGRGGKPPLQLEVAEGYSVETPGVWISEIREMSWRVRATAPTQERKEVTLRLGDAEFHKSISGSDKVVRLSPWRVTGVLDQLLYPAEPPLAGAVQDIAVIYPERTILGMPWWVAFFCLSIIFAFALRNRFGVTI